MLRMAARCKHWVLALALSIPLVDCAEWWERPWRYSWVNVTLGEQEYPVLTRRVGVGSRKLFCVQGGPGGLFWDLNFLAVYLDLERFEVLQYNALGDTPSSCSDPSEPCAQDTSWMNVNAFVSMMEQVHTAMRVPDDAIIIGHSFGVVCTLEFLLRWPDRAAGAVLSDWVASTDQSRKRADWCKAGGWESGECRLYRKDKEEPWRLIGETNKLLGKSIWGPHGDGMGGALEGWDVRDRLWSLRHIPTLSIVGSKDIVLPEDVQKMSDTLSGTYVFLKHAGHFSFTDQRERWLEAFEDWLQDVPPPRDISSGCRAPALKPILDPQPRQVGDRRYFISTPATYSQGRPHSVVVSVHPLMGDPVDASYYGPVPKAAGDVILAFPEGQKDAFIAGDHQRSWNGTGSVGSPGPEGPTCKLDEVHTKCADSCAAMGGCHDRCWFTTCADDVTYISQVLDDLEANFCINTGSVHAMGFSGGGWFVIELGTNPLVAHRFASVVSISGLPFRGFNKVPGLRKGGRFLGIFGRSDSYVPGFPNSDRDPTEAVADTGWYFSTWANTSALWARTWGCGDLRNGSRLRPDADGLDCFDYGCHEGAVSVCLWDGGHDIAPGSLSVAWQTFFPGAAPSIWIWEDQGHSWFWSAVAGGSLAGLLALGTVLWAKRRQAPALALPLLPETSA